MGTKKKKVHIIDRRDAPKGMTRSGSNTFGSQNYNVQRQAERRGSPGAHPTWSRGGTRHQIHRSALLHLTPRNPDQQDAVAVRRVVNASLPSHCEHAYRDTHKPRAPRRQASRRTKSASNFRYHKLANHTTGTPLPQLTSSNHNNTRRCGEQRTSRHP